MTYGISHIIVLFIEKATKYCGEDGQWFRHPESNKTWSNYTLCAANTKEKLRVMYHLHNYCSWFLVTSFYNMYAN